MRRFFILFSLLSVVSLVQGILKGIVVFNGIAIFPDIALIILVLFSVEFGRGVGQSAGWLGGILEDFALAQPLGVNAMVKMLMGTTFGALKGRFVVGAVLVALFTVGVATIFKYAVTWLIARIFGLEIYSLFGMMMNMLVELALNLLITLPIFWLVRRILKAVADFIRWEQKI